jgi:hypothetical protein
MFEDNFKFEISLIPSEKFKLNASLVKHGNRYFCAYRSDHMHRLNPRNYLTELDKNLNPISHIRLTPENGNTAFEDIRLFSFNKNLLAIYTAFEKIDACHWDWKYHMEIGIVDIETGIISKQSSLKNQSLREHEKNWTPYVSGDFLYIITDFDPNLRILRSTKKNTFLRFKDFYFSDTTALKWDFGEVRGGTPFLPGIAQVGNWQYSFVHSSLFVPNGDDTSRFYFYTVVRFDHETKLIQWHNKPLNYSKWHNMDDGYYELIKQTIDPSIRVVLPKGLLYLKN